jgi:Smg protein
MIDILVYLFENYQDLSAHPKPDALARKLSAIGFEDEDISLALVWLNGLKNSRPAEWSSSALSHRVYTADEQLRLGVECLNFVIFLETAGVISPHLRELVIEQAILLDDDPVTLDKFKIIVLMVLWSREQDLEPLIVEELLYNDDPELMH